jgi:hypothetical protein
MSKLWSFRDLVPERAGKANEQVKARGGLHGIGREAVPASRRLAGGDQASPWLPQCLEMADQLLSRPVLVEAQNVEPLDRLRGA